MKYVVLANIVSNLFISLWSRPCKIISLYVSYVVTSWLLRCPTSVVLRNEYKDIAKLCLEISFHSQKHQLFSINFSIYVCLFFLQMFQRFCIDAAWNDSSFDLLQKTSYRTRQVWYMTAKICFVFVPSYFGDQTIRATF